MHDLSRMLGRMAEKNTAHRYGGGVSATGAHMAISLSNCTFMENTGARRVRALLRRALRILQPMRQLPDCHCHKQYTFLCAGGRPASIYMLSL